MKRKFKILTILMCAAVLLVGSVVSVSAAYNSSASLSVDGWRDENGNLHSWTTSNVSSNVLSRIDDYNYWGYKSVHDTGVNYFFYLIQSPGYVYLSEGETAGGESLLRIGANQLSGDSFTSSSYLQIIISLDSTGTIIGESYDSLKYYMSNSVSPWCTKDYFIENMLFCSNSDILYSDGSLFFHPAEPPVVATALAPVDLTAVMKELLLMIPIGLACWVGYKALRKGLALLRQILYQA